MRRLVLFAALALMAATAAAGAVSTAFSTASFTTDSTTAVQATTPGGAHNTMRANGGEAQTAIAGTAVATPPSVLVTDAGGIPISGATVVFAVAAGGGSVTGESAVTDASGVAAVGSWTLGTTAGENVLTATVAGIGGLVSFSATGVAGPAATCAVTADHTTPAAGSVVTVTARYADRYGNALAVAGILTTFTLNGSGLLNGADPALTDSSGAASIELMTSTIAGATATVAATGPDPSCTGTSPTITTVAGPAARISATAGNAQTATVGTAVATSPAVLVTDQFNNPTSGVAVTFSATAGGGSVTGGSATTNASGVAAAGSWTLGTTAGANALTATASGLSGSPVNFTATGIAGAATKYVVTPATASPVAGSAVTVTAQLADQYGNAVATSGISVTFTRTGGGSLSGTNPATTSVTGAASISLTTGNTAGVTSTVSASSSSPSRSGTSPTITTVAGPPSKISASAGTGQSATVGTAVATSPAVLVTDANNNPVSGTTVTFAVTGGGGSVTPASVTTNASGIAAAGWTLGTTAGTNTLTATASGLSGSPVTFTATGTAGPATKYVVTAGTTSPVAGASTTISAQLADQYGNAVGTSGITVTWSKSGSGGSLGATSSTTSGSGIATVSFTTGTTAGTTYTVTASSTSPSVRTGTSPAITTVAGNAARIALNGGDAQSATVGTVVATDPSVLVTDANNNPVSGLTVTFSVNSGGGSITGASATTDASGIATVASWTLGTTAGANTLRATASGLSDASVTITATGVAGAATKYVVTSSSYTPSGGGAVTITAQLADQYGNAVKTSGITVTWSKTGSGGTLSATTSATNSNGIATVTLTTASPKNRTYTVTATDSSGRTGTTPTITTR